MSRESRPSLGIPINRKDYLTTEASVRSDDSEYITPDCGTLCKFYMDGMIKARNDGQRYGQALFNLLAERRPELAEAIRGTPRDPFHLHGPAQNFTQWDAFATFVECNWY